MRSLLSTFSFGLFLTLTPMVSAMTAPMTEDEMLEVAVLVVEGAITEVQCNGTPQVANGATMTSYLATLTIETAIKPEDSELETVTLPFASIEYDEGSGPPSCAWSPSYSMGERGTYYLETGSSTDYYTLVHYSGFIQDEDSVGVALPSCEEGADPLPEPEPEPEPDVIDDGDVSDDDAASAEDTSEPGPEEDASGPGSDEDSITPGSEPECTQDSDCPEGQHCEYEGSIPTVCVPDASDAGSAAPEEPDAGSASDDAGSEPPGEGADEPSSGDDEGGCASGGSGGPLGLMLLGLFVLMVVARREATPVRASR